MKLSLSLSLVVLSLSLGGIGCSAGVDDGTDDVVTSDGDAVIAQASGTTVNVAATAAAQTTASPLIRRH